MPQLLRDMLMDTSIYSSTELRESQTIMDAAIEEAALRGLDMPLAMMARRLFDAAQSGERDHERLKEAALEAKVIQLRAYGCVAAPAQKVRLKGTGTSRLPLSMVAGVRAFVLAL